MTLVQLLRQAGSRLGHKTNIYDDAADQINTLEARCRQQDEEIARLNEWYDKHQESIAELKAALRRADDIEHSISAEDWYKQRDALLGSSKETKGDAT